MSAADFRYGYSTMDELTFLKGLLFRDRVVFQAIGMLILEDRRSYDTGVDVETIKQFIRGKLQ